MINNIFEIEITINFIKTLFVVLGAYIISFKMLGDKKYFSKNKICGYLILLVFLLLISSIRSRVNFFIRILLYELILSFIYSITTKKDLLYSVVITIISLGFNYVIFFLSSIVAFILSKVFEIKIDIINLSITIIIHVVQLMIISRIRKVKYGLSFLKKESKNEYLDIILLSISTMILILMIILVNFNIKFAYDVIPTMIMFSIIMFITIQKSLQLYYKQKLVMKELNETKEELENKKKEIEELEKENLNFSKTSHSLAHKQKALEFKINELMTKSEISEEYDIKERVQNLSKEIYGKTTTVELSKTGITEIDNMLKYMQSECNKNKIEFNLQIIGNIYSMINNIINKDDLEILLADHIKNAIIAINHSENINRSILVKIGKIDNIYSLYIYDSGIEFEEETLTKLGKIPSTTHANEGGTGMGFMNTFDTLSKYDASLTINEFNKPNKDNYTKAIIIKFDKKNEFKIISYREKIEK